MKITIITVCYNAQSTIKQTLDSLFSQDYNEVEFILIDGNSTDKTMEIVEAYRSKFFKIISENDFGMYDALNKGIKLANGEIIGILNSDDEFSQNSILRVIASKFMENSSIDAIIGDVAFIKNNKQIRYCSALNWQPWKFKFGNMPPHPSFYCKRKLFTQFGYYNTNFKIAGDFELLLRFIYINKIKFEYIPYKIVNMKIGGLSTSGLGSIININREILKAFRINRLKTNHFYLYSRYFKKAFEFLHY